MICVLFIIVRTSSSRSLPFSFHIFSYIFHTTALSFYFGREYFLSVYWIVSATRNSCQVCACCLRMKNKSKRQGKQRTTEKRIHISYDRVERRRAIYTLHLLYYTSAANENSKADSWIFAGMSRYGYKCMHKIIQ